MAALVGELRQPARPLYGLVMALGSSTSSHSTSRSTPSTSNSNSSSTATSTRPATPTPTPAPSSAKRDYFADGMDRLGKIELGTKTIEKRPSPPANGPWGKDEFEAGTKRTTSTKASVSITPDAVSAKVSGGFSQEVTNAHGYGVSFGVNTAASVASSQKTENGVTTFEVKSEASISVSGGISTPKAGLELAHSEGVKLDYSVSMPEAAAKTVDPKTVNPLDPASMPTGTVVSLDGARFASNEFKATFEHLALETKVTDASGVSVAVEKTGDTTVRVTAGPTQAVEAYNGVGLEVGEAKAMLGREDSLSSATLKTAEFDLSTADGKAAYDAFLTSGTIPTQNGGGVSGVATIEKLDYSSQTKLDLGLGSEELSLGGNQNTGSAVVTTLPDGTKTVSQDLDYGGNTPLHIERAYDATGKEKLGERRYSYTLSVDGNPAALMLNSALQGALTHDGTVKPGQTVTLTFTEDQMRGYLDQTRTATDAKVMGDLDRSLVYDTDGNPVTSPEAFAVGLAQSLNGGDYRQLERMYNTSMGADGDYGNGQFTPIDVTVAVK